MLFKSAPQTFNPQIHTEELSLTSQMDKDFSVHNKVLSRYERYCKFTSFLFHSGRINGGARAGWIKRPSADKEVHDNAHRVQFRSLNIKPAYTTGGALFGAWFDTNNGAPDMTAVTTVTYTGGITSTTVVADTLGSIPLKHDPANNIFGDKYNPGDKITLDGGLGIDLWIQRVRLASTGDHYILDFKTIGSAAEFDEAHLAEDTVTMDGGNLFGEGSMRGYQRYHTTYWKIYYSMISRYTLSFTGSSLDQRRVHWTDQTLDGARTGKGLWQYEEEWFADEMFSIMLELGCRFSNSSMDPSTHRWFESSGRNALTMNGMAPELGKLPPRQGEGWIKQFKNTIDLDYDVNAGLSPYLLEGICNIITSQSPIGGSGNTIIVLGDDVAYDNWDKGMKQLLGWNVATGSGLQASHNTNMVMDVTNGQAVKLGFTVESYEYKGNKFVFMHDELFAHPGLNKRSGGLVGSGNMYFINVSITDEGVSNFELFSRGNGRFFIKKYVDGLHSLNPERNKSMFASTGFDGCFAHYLADLMPIVYFEDTCAVLRGTGDYEGGGLAGNTGLGNFPIIR